MINELNTIAYSLKCTEYISVYRSADKTYLPERKHDIIITEKIFAKSKMYRLTNHVNEGRKNGEGDNCNG